MSRSIDTNVVSIHEDIVAKNVEAISKASSIIVENALTVLRLTGMKQANILGINPQTGDSECEIVITLTPQKGKSE